MRRQTPTYSTVQFKCIYLPFNIYQIPTLHYVKIVQIVLLAKVFLELLLFFFIFNLRYTKWFTLNDK